MTTPTGLRRWDLVRVLWDDAHGDSLPWETPNPHEPTRIVTVGQLYKRDKRGLTVVLSRMAGTDQVDAYIFVPLSCIVRIDKLAARPERKA